jgi:hypothetical protein
MAAEQKLHDQGCNYRTPHTPRNALRISTHESRKCMNVGWSTKGNVHGLTSSPLKCISGPKGRIVALLEKQLQNVCPFHPGKSTTPVGN